MMGLYRLLRSVVFGSVGIVVGLGIIGLWFRACEGGV